MPRVVHFEINADDPDRAVKFYTEALGWKISKWGPMEYWLIETGEKEEPGIDGAIMAREKDWATVNTVSVPSLDEFTKRVEKAGGQVVSPRQTIPGIGYHSYCLDSEGNISGILEEDTSAKQTSDVARRGAFPPGLSQPRVGESLAYGDAATQEQAP